MSADSINDGGAAFPVVTNQYHYAYEKDMPATVEPGMSLRDYFAAKAMQAALPVCGPDSRKEGESYCEHVACVAYEMADAMLAARAAQ